MEPGRQAEASAPGVRLAHNAHLVPGLAHDSGRVVAEQLLGLVNRHVGELDEGALGRDLPALHRLPPYLPGLLPPVVIAVVSVLGSERGAFHRGVS